MTLIPRRITSRPVVHAAYAAYAARDLDTGYWMAQCDACDFTGDVTTIECEALADAEGHMRAARFGRLR